MISILWGGILGSLFLFFIFWTPVKPSMTPPPPSVEEVMELEAKELESGEVPGPASEDPPAAAASDQVVNITHVPITSELIAEGKSVYMANCITCHNKDPNSKGPIGPELKDTPLEVMIVKVRTGRYPVVLPSGFVPKRKTKQMKKLPHLEDKVQAIHAWIQSMKI